MEPIKDFEAKARISIKFPVAAIIVAKNVISDLVEQPPFEPDIAA